MGLYCDRPTELHSNQSKRSNANPAEIWVLAFEVARIDGVNVSCLANVLEMVIIHEKDTHDGNIDSDMERLNRLNRNRAIAWAANGLSPMEGAPPLK